MKVHRDTRSHARPGLLMVLVALAVVLMTVWYREGDSGPLHRAQSTVSAVAAPVSAAGEIITRPVRGFFAWTGDLGVSRSRLEQLRAQNARLRARVAELEEARLENERLTDLLKLVPTESHKATGARVIGRPTNAWEGVITIDRGSEDGITVGMPVVGPLGLLGQTIQVSKGSAKVRLITDHRSGVAVMIQRSRAEGILKGSIDGRLTMEFVSAETTLSAGDVVITSGMGGVFPKGLVVGEVAQSGQGTSGFLQSVRVLAASAPSSLEEVLVLIGEPPSVKTGGGE